MQSERAIIWSSGGGTQSVAIWILIEQGVLPMPERIVMADTGREASEVWRYHDEHIAPRMARLGKRLEIVGHEWARVDLYRNDDLIVPAYTADGGMLGKFCSNEWKRRPVRRYLRSLGYGPKRPIVMWLGMSIDEIGRLDGSGAKWITNDYPLCAASRRVRPRTQAAGGVARQYGLSRMLDYLRPHGRPATSAHCETTKNGDTCGTAAMATGKRRLPKSAK